MRRRGATHLHAHSRKHIRGGEGERIEEGRDAFEEESEGVTRRARCPVVRRQPASDFSCAVRRRQQCPRVAWRRRGAASAAAATLLRLSHKSPTGFPPGLEGHLQLRRQAPPHLLRDHRHVRQHQQGLQQAHQARCPHPAPRRRHRGQVRRRRPPLPNRGLRPPHRRRGRLARQLHDHFRVGQPDLRRHGRGVRRLRA